MGLDALIDGFWNSLFSEPIEGGCQRFGLASGIVFGSNPPYGLSDLLAIYPKFFGTPTSVTGAIEQGQATLTLPAAIPNLAMGNLVVDPAGNLPAGTVIASVNGTNVTLSNAATATVAAETLNVYTAPWLPTAVMVMYINLASASLAQSLWCEKWYLAMGLYVAHFCTLYLRSEANPGCSATQVAASGLQKGILISRGTGPLSGSIQVPSGLEGWGSWTETGYGSQLVSDAKVIGSAPFFVL